MWRLLRKLSARRKVTKEYDYAVKKLQTLKLRILEDRGLDPDEKRAALRDAQAAYRSDIARVIRS